MKRLSYLILIFLLSVTFSSCGGGGGTGIDLPPITQSDKIELRADSYIAQFGGSITLEATVSSKGRAVSGTEVTFTNLSAVGDFCNGIREAITDSSGKAKVCIYSTTPGFSRVQAEVNTGAGIVRDRKSVFFTTAIVIYPSLTASIDGDGDGNYNEPDDFILIANGRDRATLRAQLLDATGMPIVGKTILFSTDTTYIDCTESKTACEKLAQPFHEEVLFPNGRTAWTNSNGEGTIEIVLSSNIKEFRTSFNVAAQDTTSGASGLFTVFLDPITVGAITVTAYPPIVSPTEPSFITAYVVTTNGVPVPDGTIVNFTVTPSDLGTIDAFSQTTTGIAEAVFISSGKEGIATITAAAGGASGTTTVTVTTTLTVQPSAVTVDGATPADIIPFTIFGGISPYTVTSSNPAITLSAITATATGGTFTATVPASTPAGSVTITVRDSAGTTATATITIEAGPVLNVLPSTRTLTNPVGGNTATYTISGGSAPYSAFSSHPSLVSVAVVGTTLTATVVAVPTTDTTVTITVRDSVGTTKTVTLILDVPAPPTPLTVGPTSDWICENDTTCSFPSGPIVATFTISGGTPSYSVSSSNTSVIPNPTVIGNTFTVDAINNSIFVDTAVTLTITDSGVPSQTAAVIVTVINQ